MTEITQVKLDEMLAGLEGVTPGPWEFNPGDDYYISAKAYPTECTHRFKGDDLGDMLAEIGNRPADFGEANAAHIARCDPDTMRALIALASQALRSQGEAWCQPDYGGEIHPQKFLVVYEDAEVGNISFDDEAEAREHFDKAISNWNCYLFGLMPRTATHPAPQEAVEVKVTDAMLVRIVDALNMAHPHTLEFDAESGGYYDTDLSREISALLSTLTEGSSR